jgi:hypothetical protein
MVPFGGSCGPDHTQSGPGAATPTGDSFDVASVTVMDDTALSRGFAVTSSGLNTLAQDCNEVVSAEALMMQKEHIGDTLGQIRYTIGEGCSGGSIQQYNIAADYPGLLNGITPMCSFPDDWTPITDGTDCELLLHYFDQTSSELWATPQEGLVEGKEGVGTPCDVWTATLTDALDPSARGSFRLGIYSLPNCGTPPNQIYDPKTNRKGVRCDVQDYQSSLWGFRPQDGFAKRPLDNIGVQYGLEALNSGEITAAQFVDLNSKIGGLSIDDDFIPQRMAMDPVVARIMYRSGRSTDARQLADVPIIDLRGQDNEEVHQSFYSYMTRLRLDQANGTHANQVIWTGAIPLQGTTDFVPAAFLSMDRWLSVIERDRRRLPLAQKVIQDKPGDIVDTCWVQGQAITDTTTCRNLSGYYADPRIAAGAPLTDDVRKCQLKPLNRVDYRVSFSDAQWAELQRAFPTGVCDWQLSSAGQQRSIPWMSYTKGPGGNPLGPPPVPIPLSRRCDGQRPPCAKRGSVLLHSRGL